MANIVPMLMTKYCCHKKLLEIYGLENLQLITCISLLVYWVQWVMSASYVSFSTQQSDYLTVSKTKNKDSGPMAYEIYWDCFIQMEP